MCLYGGGEGGSLGVVNKGWKLLKEQQSAVVDTLSPRFLLLLDLVTHSSDTDYHSNAVLYLHYSTVIYH